MIALIQRVARARVSCAAEVLGDIDAGILALVCAEKGDGPAQARALVDKVLGFRIFSDDLGRMNRSLTEVGGALLIVPQFTLAADTRSGTRASFTPAAEPLLARPLFDKFVEYARSVHASVEAGRFGADMDVELVNRGPVTFWLRVDPPLAHESA
jgi:D-tyrosyl-tRNA(Tyr) deacylase